jgi:hypothetical protein
MYPRMIPCFGWFTRIEIVQNNNIIDTIYPISNFLKHQMFTSDEERKKLNHGAGDYLNSVNTYYKTWHNDSEYWYLPLWTYFKLNHIPLLNPKDDIQIRLYMADLKNCVIVQNIIINIFFNYILKTTISKNIKNYFSYCNILFFSKNVRIFSHIFGLLYFEYQ